MVFVAIESFLASKSGDDAANEDVIMDGADWLVVCDGATDKSNYELRGSTGGRIAAQLTAKVLAAAGTGTPAHGLVEAINEAYNDTFGPDLARLGDDRPSCSFVAIDKKAAFVLRVGDVSWSDGRTSFMGSKEIDVVHSRMRAAYLRMMMIDGKGVSDLSASDPGRELILPSLRKQAVLRNCESAGDLAFGAIDGRPVPHRFIETWELDNDVTDVVIATDGYPAIQDTLELSEQYLRSDLHSDPLRIGRHLTTKGVRPGNQSFDDRAFVRLRRE